jgi:prepilin-type N-terminal cleavage/methylation domain-containing protein
MVMLSKLRLIKRLTPAFGKASPASGFTLIEVMISMMITLIVMSAVFGLLSRGQSTFQREPEIADMQQSARAALDMVTKDAIQAGAGLPPEFPTFDGVDNGPDDPDEIWIVGSLGGSYQVSEPAEVDPTSFTGDQDSSAFKTAGNWSNIEIGDLVVLYDNLPLNGYWIMGYVQDVQPDGLGQMDITLEPDPPAGEPGGTVLDDYKWRGETPPVSGWAAWTPAFVTPISVVHYFATPDPTLVDSGPAPNQLLREVNFDLAEATPVAYLENFQVRYVFGVTAATPAGTEDDLPPVPLALGAPLTADDVVNGVQIRVDARSLSENLQGATEGATAADGNFIRKTFSSNVNPRNISSGLAFRTKDDATGPVYQ